MVYLTVKVSSFSFVFKVGVGAFGDGLDCVMHGEIVALLWRWRR
jgi:hypothetical protein